jgi:hypothetical protein
MEGVLVALEDRFHENLERVTDLVVLYDRVTGPASRRPSVQESELLRMAVVFLHAALEDLLRGVAEWRLPAASTEFKFRGFEGGPRTVRRVKIPPFARARRGVWPGNP